MSVKAIRSGSSRSSANAPRQRSPHLNAGTMTQCSEDLANQIAKWLRRDVDELFIRNEDSRVARMTNAAGSKRQLATV